MNIKHQETTETEAKTAYPPQTTSVKERQNTPTPPPTHIHKLLHRWLSTNTIRELYTTHRRRGSVNPLPLLQLLEQASPNNWKERTLAVWLLGEIPLTEQEKERAVQLLGKTTEKSFKKNILKATARLFLRGATVFAYWGLILVVTQFTFWFLDVNIKKASTSILIKILFECLDWGLRLMDFGMDTTIYASHLSPNSYLQNAMGVVFMCLWLFVIMPSPIIIPLYTLLDTRREKRVRLEAIEALRKRGEVTALPYLLGALKSRDAKIANAAYQVIVELLPKLTPEHYGHLRSDVGQNLCLLFGTRYDLPYLTILDAIEKVGDSRAIPKIQWVLANEPQQEIKRRGEEVLIVLKEREQLERQTKDLLRASQEPISKETLLRPASPQTEVETDTLLRPSDL